MDYVMMENMMYSMEEMEQDVRDWLAFEADMADQPIYYPTDEELNRMEKTLI